MADATVTLTGVIPSASADIRSGVCGVTIAAGQVLYIDTANSNVLKLADQDAGSLLVGTVAGIALCGGATGQTIRYVTSDPALTFPIAAMVVGDIVLLGNTPGGVTITPGDLVTGEFVTVIGVCTVAATTINMKLVAAGAAKG